MNVRGFSDGGKALFKRKLKIAFCLIDWTIVGVEVKIYPVTDRNIQIVHCALAEHYFVRAEYVRIEIWR